MSQYWINVLSSAHNISIILGVAMGIIVLAQLYWYAIASYNESFKISFKYPLISIIVLILTLLLYIFTSPIN